MAIRAVQTCTFRALALVPTKVLIFRFCLRALKNSSIGHRSWSMAAMVVAPKARWLVKNTRVSSFSGAETSTRRSRGGHVVSASAPVRRITSSRRTWLCSGTRRRSTTSETAVSFSRVTTNDPGSRQPAEPGVVHVAAVEDQDRPGIQAQVARDPHSMPPALGNDQRFGEPFGFLEILPGR